MKPRPRNLFELRYNNRNDNLGDQAIFRALVCALQQHGEVTMVGAVPPFVEGVRPTGGPWRSRFATAATKARGGSVVRVLAPGALLWPRPDCGTPSPRRARSGLAAKWLRARTISVGRSVIGAADHSWCQDVDWIGVRDDASLRALHQAGFRQVSYFPDLSFLLDSDAAGADARTTVAFSFRSRIPEDHRSAEYEHTVRGAFDAIVGSLGPSGRARAIGFYQVQEDEAPVGQLCEDHGVSRAASMLTLSSYQPFYRTQDLVVSNRLHCLLLGACQGAIPVALTTEAHTKVVSLFRTVGWDSLIVRADDDARVDRFHEIRRQSHRLRELVRTTFDRQRTLGAQTLRQAVLETGGAS